MANPKEQGLTYALTYKDVVEILRLINESSHCESLELEFGGLRLSATRAVAAGAGPAAPRASAAPAPAPETLAQSDEQSQGGEAVAEATAETGLIPIRSPMLGTFYRAPAPGEPPYVEPGDVVDADTVIGLIDVMKLFTQIPAGVAGRVVEIVAHDAVLVEYGQPLVLIDPFP